MRRGFSRMACRGRKARLFSHPHAANSGVREGVPAAVLSKMRLPQPFSIVKEDGVPMPRLGAIGGLGHSLVGPPIAGHPRRGRRSRPAGHEYLLSPAHPGFDHHHLIGGEPGHPQDHRMEGGEPPGKETHERLGGGVPRGASAAPTGRPWSPTFPNATAARTTPCSSASRLGAAGGRRRAGKPIQKKLRAVFKTS